MTLEFIRVGCLVGFALLGAAFCVACVPVATPTPTTSTVVATSTTVLTNPIVTASTKPPSPATIPLTPSPGTLLKLDVDAIFPPGEGRELVLENCTVCHSFLRLVVGKRTKDQWEYVRRDMRREVSHLNDQEVDRLFNYLEANFNETKPVPDLPDWFLQTGEW